MRSAAVRLLKENIEKKFDIGLCKGFLEITPEAQPPEEKISKWDYSKLKSSAQQKKQFTE